MKTFLLFFYPFTEKAQTKFLSKCRDWTLVLVGRSIHRQIHRYQQSIDTYTTLLKVDKLQQWFNKNCRYAWRRISFCRPNVYLGPSQTYKIQSFTTIVNGQPFTIVLKRHLGCLRGSWLLLYHLLKDKSKSTVYFTSLLFVSTSL